MALIESVTISININECYIRDSLLGLHVTPAWEGLPATMSSSPVRAGRWMDGPFLAKWYSAIIYSVVQSQISVFKTLIKIILFYLE